MRKSDMYFTRPKSFFSFLTLFMVVSVSTYAQGTIIPLMQEGWVGGLSGFIGWDNYTTQADNGNIYMDLKSKGFNFIISSRNGRFVEDNLAFGFDLQWEEKSLSTEPTGSQSDGSTIPFGLDKYSKIRLGFLGLWVRYYIPFIGTGWAVFPEASAGYGNYKSESQFTEATGGTMISNTDASADGFVYHIGFGGTIFVSNNVAFEATVRYQGGKLTGNYEIRSQNLDNLEVKLSNIDVLFGIMVYLR